MTELISQTLASLKRSKFRSKCKLTKKDRQYIPDKDIDTIRQHDIDFIKNRITPARLILLTWSFEKQTAFNSCKRLLTVKKGNKISQNTL